RDFEITAIARNTDTIIDKKVNKISVDVNNVEKLTEALKGQDVVISAFNAGWTNPNIYEDFIAGSKSIQEAVKKASAQRLIVIGGAGSLYTTEKQQIVDMVDFRSEEHTSELQSRENLVCR